MKKRQTALTAIGALIATPIIGVAATTFVSCKKAQDDSGISVSTKDVEVNHNSGVGEFDIILDEQPVDNKIYVFVVTAEGPHHMELLDTDERVYHGHPAILYDCYNGVSHVRMGFTEFVGVSTKTVVSLQVRYNNRKGEWILKNIHDINLTVTYQQNPIEEVHLFSLNDLHGVAEGYGEDEDMYPTTNIKDAGVIRIMNEIAPVIDSHPGSFLVTAGDNNSGDMFSTSVHGESIFNVLKAMGARYSAVGNHAFEWGLSPMATYQFDKWARTEDTMGSYYVASNILNGKIDQEKEWCTNPKDPAFEEDYAMWQSQRVGWADPYKLVNMNGHLVCLIGLTTQATLQDGNKSVVDNLSFIDYNAAVDYSIYTCKQETKEQLFDSIESFVLLTHVESSIDETTHQPEGDAIEIAEEVTEPKIDAIISAHSHKNVDVAITNGPTGKKIWVGQAETEGRAYLDLTFRFDNTKPVGQKKVDVGQKVVSMRMEEKYPGGPTKENYQAAHEELESIKKSPRSPNVLPVINEFNRQSIVVDHALDEKIATRSDSLLYPAVTEAKPSIGHGYYINQKKTKTDKPKDGGYIIDQMGAWINYAGLIGFQSIYQKDIESSSKGLTYPAISFINEDSMKVQYTDKPTSKPVILKDMYSIQTYENTTKFGYLSIWQMANVINHALAGAERFNYDAPKFNYYSPKTTDPGSINDLTQYCCGPNRAFSQTACDSNNFVNRGTYKGLADTYCLYPCGPTQFYGCKFALIEADNPEEEDRVWQVGYVEGDPEKIAADPDYPKYFPNIWIMDPLKDEKHPYSTVLTPNEWLSAEEYYNNYDGMIPIVTNNFLYDGANWETPLFEAYMKYNEGLDWRSYPVMSFSTITRDLLIEFCKKTDDIGTPFDMPIEIVEQIAQYPE